MLKREYSRMLIVCMHRHEDIQTSGCNSGTLRIYDQSKMVEAKGCVMGLVSRAWLECHENSYGDVAPESV